MATGYFSPRDQSLRSVNGHVAIKACLRRTVSECLSHDAAACAIELDKDGVITE